MKVFRHIVIVFTALALLVGIPVFQTGYLQRRLGGADAVSAATVILDQPSGAYVVLINSSLHQNRENLAVWESFFRGEEIGFLFEDISCVVAESDAAGMELARSFQSRLPENQMRLRREDITLMLSKVLCGNYDVALLSKEAADAYHATAGLNLEQTVLIEEAGL